MNKPLSAIIHERFERTLEQIAQAASRSGRKSSEVRLVVVTKAQPVEVVAAAIEAGAGLLGENYAEEAVQKITVLDRPGVEWHMIGHVQSRKANLVAEYFSMLHSLDRTNLAQRLEDRCAELGRVLPVLLEVNVSGETSKYGIPAWDEDRWEDMLPTMAGFLEYPHINIRGLMTMPPFFAEPDQARPFFQKLRRLQAFLGAQMPAADWRDLSMGTSGDFSTAVEEGATFVRVGQAILGQRPQAKELP